MNNKNDVGERIKKIRGLETQTSFASRLGITQRAVVNYETLGRIPKGSILRKICEQYGVKEKWLLTGDGPMYQENDAQVASAPKMADMSVILEGRLPQHTDFISSEKSKMTDTSAILRLTEKCLQLSTENGDLRVEVERQRARIADLERQLAETPVQAPDEALARLERDNRNLREEVCRLKRGRMADPPETDEMQTCI